MTEQPTYGPRLYPDIVRDLLTTLTGGTVREAVTAPVDGPVVLDRLAQRPVRRVSHLDGLTPVGATNVPVRFTDADFELADLDGDGEPDAIVFRENGRKPAPGTTLTVNYYPAQIARPVPLTDLNVGSVVRTLLETVGREVAQTEQYLDLIYRSAFIETAEGGSLDRVVALIGMQRLPAGFPLVSVQFSRNAATGGRVTLPAGTVVTDAAANRYATVTDLSLEPGEASRSVLAAGLTPDTALVGPAALDRFETIVAGVTTVTNPGEAYRQAAAESDTDLRRRSRGALHGAVRGTIDALRFGVLAVQGVRSVEITEFPNGRAGEVRIDVAYESPDDTVTPGAVARRIEELRPAGIRIVPWPPAPAARRQIRVQVALVLAGTGVSGAEFAGLTTGVEERVTARLTGLAPGAPVRVNALVAAVLADARIADAEIGFTGADGTAIGTLTLAAGEVLDVLHPFAFPPPTAERTDATQVATVSFVEVSLPVHLQPGVTLAEAAEAIGLAIDGHLATRSPDRPLTVDGVAAAVRDDTRYSLVRELASLLVEHAGQFTQLLDGQGSYQVGAAEQLQRRGDAGVSEDGT
ncbi:hypothetical protein EXU48_12770 [Occultella glacieicola]|uniref:Baseplate protein J-like domain-containing protein n=1 Tax=Occultella glacieicola TaxID=2518684 RepID=A0ABY2E4T2_9MICO|nr:hypothetical protein [Occultella glacieicola]TDE92437.1 hypothetical protein EXU48_12770 [Occultella glacieicola]